MSISVQLSDVCLLSERGGDLLSNLRPAERTGREKASQAADFINARFGSGTISFGINKPHPGFFERG